MICPKLCRIKDTMQKLKWHLIIYFKIFYSQKWWMGWSCLNLVSLAICIVIRICSKDPSKIRQDHGTMAKVTIVKDGTFLLVSKRCIFILICAKKSCVLCSLKLFKGFMWNLCRMMEYCLSKSDNGEYLKKRLFVPKCVNFTPFLGSKDSVLFSFCESAWRSLNLMACQRFAMVGISGNGPGPGPKFCSSSSGILHMHRRVLQSFSDTFWKCHFEINSLYTFDFALCGTEITFWIRNQFCVLNTDLNFFNEAAYCLKI